MINYPYKMSTKMKRTIKLIIIGFIFITICASCEKACICRNLDNGAADELIGIYSKKECEDYTEYYQVMYNAQNVDCSYEWRK